MKIKGIESECNAREPKKKTQRSNLGAMSENQKQTEGIESMRDAREPEIKGRDRI